eukprot:g9954.t1
MPTGSSSSTGAQGQGQGGASATSSGNAASSSSSSSQLKRYERPGLMLDEIEEMKEAFDLFDLDGSGRVPPKDLAQAIQNLGLENKNAVVQQILRDLEKAADTEGLGEVLHLENKNAVVQQILKDLEKCRNTIEFSDFLDLFSAKMGERDTREDVAKVFRLFDDDQTGYVTVKNLAKVATELGEALTAEELNEMILRADSSHQGKVSLDDFYSLMVHRSFP